MLTKETKRGQEKKAKVLDKREHIAKMAGYGNEMPREAKSAEIRVGDKVK